MQGTRIEGAGGHCEVHRLGYGGNEETGDGESGTSNQSSKSHASAFGFVWLNSTWQSLTPRRLHVSQTYFRGAIAI